MPRSKSNPSSKSLWKDEPGHQGSWPPLHLSPVPQADIDRGDGDEVIDFIEAFCTITKDGFAGKTGDPIILRPWQKTLVRHLRARRPDGRLRARRALIGMPRKNAKSAIGSGLALDALVMTGNGTDVFSAAAEKEQARLVFGEAKKMVETSSDLSDIARIMKDVIEIPSTGSMYRVLSAEAYSKEGLNVSMAIVDELHALPNADLWNVLTLASAARIDPLVIAITTAGVMKDSTGYDSICYQLYQYGKKLASGELEDPSFFFAWWGAPDGCNHRDPDIWRQANPGFGDLIDPDDFASAVNITAESEFRTKRLNMWVSSMTTWFPAGVWETRTDFARTIEPGTKVVLGFDGSRNGDATALVIVTVEEQPHIDVIGVWERPLDASPDYQVPRAEVLEAIRKACRDYQVLEIATDTYLWQTEMQELDAEGLPIVQISQSAAHMVPATQRFYEAVMTNGMTHSGDLTLARHVSNAILKQTSSGAVLSKDSKGSPRKIDAAVASVMAFDRALSPGLNDGGPNLW